MDVGIKFFYILLVCTSLITICFAPFGLIFSSLCLKTVHFNLRFLIFILGLFWCILPIGGMYFYFILDAEENPPLLYQRTQYQIAKNICAISGYAFRVIETTICIERLFATIYFETYESKKVFRIYSIFSTFISLVMTSCLSFLFNICKFPKFGLCKGYLNQKSLVHIHIAVIYVFLISVEFINFSLLYILKKRNHKLRQLSNSNRIMLSSKYQLIENIKSLNLLFPQATISFVMSNSTLIITSLIRELYIEGYAPPIYFIIYNLNVIMVSIYWITRSPWYKKNINRIRKLWLQKINNSTEVVTLKPITVKTALGQTVKVQQTVEDYFNGLKHVWK